MNPIFISGLLSALLPCSLLVIAAWLLILTQSKASAARRSTACRLSMAAAMTLLAIAAGNGAISLLPARMEATDHIQPDLPSGDGTTAENPFPDLAVLPVISYQEPSPLAPPGDSSPALSLVLSAGSARWLMAAWITGAGLVLLAWIRSLVARLILLRRSKNAAGFPWLLAAGKIQGWQRVDRVRLFPQEITPCVWGVFQTVLVVPASASAWPVAKLKLVLTHECAHLLRRDPLWQGLSRLFVAMFWFHPLAWSLARRSQAADEQAADDTVLRTESDAPSYAALLVECARQLSFPPALQAIASAMASPTTLTRRVEAVLDPAADRRPVNLASMLVWSTMITLVSGISSFAAPEIAIPAEQENFESNSASQKPRAAPNTPEAQALPKVSPPSESTPAATKVPAPAGISAPPADHQATEDTKKGPEQTKGAPTPKKISRTAFKWQIIKKDGIDYIPTENIATFYRFPLHSTEEDGHFFMESLVMKVKGTIDSPNIIINGTLVILKHPVASQGKAALISRQDVGTIFGAIFRNPFFGKPSPVTTVVIDAGHGGSDSGASGSFGKESTYTLDTAKRLQQLLEKDGLKTVMTRSDDSFADLKSRAKRADAEPDAIFISLHYNASSSGGPQGIQTFYPEASETNSNPAPSVSAPQSYRSFWLAAAVHQTILGKSRAKDGGISSAGFSVFSGQNKNPGILIECGSLTNPEESAKIATEAYRQSIAQAIADGVQYYVKAAAATTDPWINRNTLPYVR